MADISNLLGNLKRLDDNLDPNGVTQEKSTGFKELMSRIQKLLGGKYTTFRYETRIEFFHKNIIWYDFFCWKEVTIDTLTGKAVKTEIKVAKCKVSYPTNFECFIMDTPELGTISVPDVENVDYITGGGRDFFITYKNSPKLFVFGVNSYGCLGVGHGNSCTGGATITLPGIPKHIQHNEVIWSYSNTTITLEDGTFLFSGYNEGGIAGTGNQTNTTSFIVGANGMKFEKIWDSGCDYRPIIGKTFDGEYYIWGWCSYITGVAPSSSFYSGRIRTPTKMIFPPEADEGRNIVDINIRSHAQNDYWNDAWMENIIILLKDGTMWGTGQVTYYSVPGYEPRQTLTSNSNWTSKWWALKDEQNEILRANLHITTKQIIGTICALDDNDSLWTWGRAYGSFGDGSEPRATGQPRKVLDNVAKVVQDPWNSETAVYVKLKNGEWWGFGNNFFGNMGETEYTIKTAKKLNIPNECTDAAIGGRSTTATSWGNGASWNVFTDGKNIWMSGTNPDAPLAFSRTPSWHIVYSI